MRDGENLVCVFSCLWARDTCACAPDSLRPRYTAPADISLKWRLMFDPFYLLSLSMPGQLCAD